MKRWLLCLALGAAACGVAPEDGSSSDEMVSQEAELSRDLAPTGRGGGLAREVSTDAAAKPRTTTSTGINYHGGPVMLGTVNLYYIWYGSWSGDSAPSILGDLARGLGGTPYYGINTTYTDGSGRSVSNSVALAREVNDAYSRGKSLGSSDIQAIVASQLSSGALPVDPNGVYFVLTSQDVAVSGFCSSFCGWHDHATLSGKDIKYSFVGNAAQCPSACSAQSSSSPNGNVGADAMASIIAHELDEAVTDPDLNAWFDRRGQENADKCAWTFGTTYTTSNGSKANLNFGGRDWLIQRNWVNSGSGGCTLAWPAVAASP